MSRLLERMTDDEVSRAFPVDAEAGFGALATERGRLPLAAVDVRARLDGLLSQVTVCQTFVNTFSDPLEATYIFPLPDRAAVTHFRMEVGGRVIEGQLKERGQARRDYDRAIRSGHRAAITEEDRAGVFTMRVGNLMPGEEATVRLTLAGPLPYADGEATFHFPLVVAPRYIPGAPLPGPSAGDGIAADTDAVPDASRISPPVLLPGFPNPVRLSLSVEILPSGLPVSEVRSTLHAIEEETAGRVRRITLQPGARLDRDFILRLRLGDGRLHTSLSLHSDPANRREGTFLLTVVPPPGKTVSRPRDVIFVLDRSGSMQGWKMVAARRAVARMVDTLLEQDRFAVLAFDDRVETPPDFGGVRLVNATDRKRFRAVEFLAQIDSRGGTEMAQPLELAVRELSEAGPGRERILVLITDGQVGNEDQILHALGSRLRQLRVFCLGIDRAVNAAFLNRLAEMGGGSCELVESEDRLDEVMEHIHRRIAQPVLTRLKLEPAGLALEADSLVPGRLPDVFAGSPLLILGRYRGAAEGSVVLQAEEAGQPWQTTVRGAASENPALAAVWARGQVRKLEDRYLVDADRQRLEKRIVETSLRFGVLSRFTAFVAVDLLAQVNAGGKMRGVVQLVETPDSWTQNAVPAAAAPPAAMKTMLARQVLQELNDGGRVSKKTQLAVDDAARTAEEQAVPVPPFLGGTPSHITPELLPPPSKDDKVFETPLDDPEDFAAEDDYDLESSEFEVALGDDDTVAEDESGSQVLALEDEGFDDGDFCEMAGGPGDMKEAEFFADKRISFGEALEKPGLIQRILSFFRRRRENPTELVPPASGDPASFRQRARELEELVQTAFLSFPVRRWDSLLALTAGLEKLLKDLVNAGVLTPEVERLARLLQQLLALRAEADAGAAPARLCERAETQALWQEAQAALRAFAGDSTPDTEGSRREGFWK